jgi:hypothetical protein
MDELKDKLREAESENENMTVANDYYAKNLVPTLQTNIQKLEKEFTNLRDENNSLR